MTAIATSVGPSSLPHSSGTAIAIPSGGSMTAVRLTLRSRRVMAERKPTTRVQFLPRVDDNPFSFYAEAISLELDPKIAAAIEPELPTLADEIVAAIQRE